MSNVRHEAEGLVRVKARVVVGESESESVWA